MAPVVHIANVWCQNKRLSQLQPPYTIQPISCLNLVSVRRYYLCWAFFIFHDTKSFHVRNIKAISRTQAHAAILPLRFAGFPACLLQCYSYCGSNCAFTPSERGLTIRKSKPKWDLTEKTHAWNGAERLSCSWDGRPFLSLHLRFNSFENKRSRHLLLYQRK